ncbi:MAG: MarR family winged helix-turn-helix transcriptional regulator [Bacteroidota bacterium]
MKIEQAIKQKKFESDAQKAYLNILYTASWLQSESRDLYKKHGITSQQYNVLRILRGQYPNHANPKYIKDVMLDKNPDLTRLCDRLLKLGLIARAACPENRRKMNIGITEQGLALLEKIDPEVSNYFEQIAGQGQVNFALLSDLLDSMRG